MNNKTKAAIKIGDKFLIDRFNDGTIEAYVVTRLCRRWINVKSDTHSWAMPYSRIKDIIEP